MKKWNKFCCIFSLLAYSAISVHAQIRYQTALQGNSPGIFQEVRGLFLLPPSQPLELKSKRLDNILQKNDNWAQFKLSAYALPGVHLLPQRGTSLILPADFSLSHMAFFCRQEWKCERVTGIPLRLRVGSLEECDWLEQKPGALLPSR